MRPIVVRALLLPLPIDPRQVGARRRLDARGLRQLRQEVLIALARVAPHDAAQRRIRFQRRRINADGLALHQARVGEALQHPGEDRLVRLEIDQATRARNRRMIRRRLRQHQSEKLAQRKRIRGTPRNGALGIQAFEIADQQQAEVAARRQARSALVRIESLAQSFDISVEVVLIENLIQSRVERMGGTARQVLGRHPHRRLLARRCATDSHHSVMALGGSFHLQHRFGRSLLESCWQSEGNVGEDREGHRFSVDRTWCIPIARRPSAPPARDVCTATRVCEPVRPCRTE